MVRVGGPNPQQIMSVAAAVDLARKAPCDRNADVKRNFWTADVAAHNWTTRWSYTVPTGHQFQNGIAFQTTLTAIATAGRITNGCLMFGLGGVDLRAWFQQVHYETTRAALCQTITATFTAKAGDVLEMWTYSDDTINHWMAGGCIGLEYDA